MDIFKTLLQRIQHILIGKETTSPDRALKEVKKLSAFQSILAWRVKNAILEKEIAALEKIRGTTALPVMLFLLKAQLLEFELKQLITALDLHLTFSNTSAILKRKVETPKNIDDDRVTFGILRKKILTYEGKFLTKLQGSLKHIVGIRNEFTHSLFGMGDISSVNKKAQEGAKIVNILLQEVSKVEKILEKNDPIKELLKETSK